MDTVVLFRPTGPKEIAIVAANGFKRWPPRFPNQPIFYPVTNEDYARKIALDWNVKSDGAGYATRFEVTKPFMDRYPIQNVGAGDHTEWWIPAEDLEEMNDNIVGLIEIIAEFHSSEAKGTNLFHK